MTPTIQPAGAAVELTSRGAFSGRLFIGTPIYSVPEDDYCACIENLRRAQPFTYRRTRGDSLVSRARNTITAMFLASDCTDLLWIDSDIVFSPEQVARILSHDEDVVGGCYPLKDQTKLKWCFNTLPGAREIRTDGLMPVKYSGTGFLRIRRQVFEKMQAAWPELEYTADETGGEKHWDFWSVGVRDFGNGFRRYLSEDWFFCQRWLDLGGKVYVDGNVVLKHIGKAAYPLCDQMPELYEATP